METRFIEGGEYVDRQTYIETRDENSRLYERIARLEAQVNRTCVWTESGHGSFFPGCHDVFRHSSNDLPYCPHCGGKVVSDEH